MKNEHNIYNCDEKINGFFYGLERHLASFSKACTLYEELYCYWIIQKKDYIKRLQAIIMSFPGYSLHDVSHSEKIVQAIEMILGEDRIKLLSATDTWLLLECAYAHDVGMVIPIEDFINDLMSEKDDSFYNKIIKFRSDNLKLSQAVDFIYPLLYGLRKRENKKNEDMGFYFSEQDERQLLSIYDNADGRWPLQFKMALESLAQAYYRPQHGERTKKIIYSLAKRKDCPNVVPRRLKYLVGDIAFMHTEERNGILTSLEFVTSGIANDYAHPRFVAEMLRLGDLLDLDAERFNPYQLSVAGNIDIFSMQHQLKHIFIDQILISPKRIKVQANFEPKEVEAYFNDDIEPENEPNDSGVNKKSAVNIDELHKNPQHLCYEAMKLLFSWLKMLRSEIEFFSANWFKIVPDDFPGAAPRFAKEEICLEGKPVDIDEVDLIYSIDTRRAAELVEGSNMYNEPGLVFLRELIQNAIDASKMQLSQDINDGLYDGLLEEESKTLLKTPYNLFEKIKNQLNRYKIDIFINSNINDDSIEIKIRDYGIGITFKKLKQMRYIGNIFSPQDYNIRQNMPKWFQPTGSFGFGMQSIFRVTKSFKLCSRTKNEWDNPDNKAINATFYSARMGGEIYNEYMNKTDSWKFGFGTEIKIKLDKKDVDFLFRSKKFSKNLSPAPQYDPYLSPLNIVKDLVVSYIKKSCKPMLFPIYLDNRLLLSSKHMFGDFVISFDKNDGKYELNTFEDAFNKTYSFSYWDTENGILLRYSHPSENKFNIFNSITKNALYLKGIKVEDTEMEKVTRMPLFDTEVNLSGFDAKEYLQISRDRFLQEKSYKVAAKIRIANLRFIKSLAYLFSSEKHGKFVLEYFGSGEKIATIIRYIAWLGANNEDNIHEKNNFKTMCSLGENFSIRPKIPFYLVEKDHLTYYENESIFPCIPEWYTDFSHFSIESLYINENRSSVESMESGAIKAIVDCWINYYEIAMSEIRILRVSGAEKYIRIYKLSYRKKRPVVMDEETFWKYGRECIKYALEKFNEDGKDKRLLLPGIAEYIAISVCNVPQSLLTEENHRFMSWIIMPLSIRELNDIKNEAKDLDNKEFEKKLESKINEELLYDVAQNSLGIDIIGGIVSIDRIKKDYIDWLKKLFLHLNNDNVFL